MWSCNYFFNDWLFFCLMWCTNFRRSALGILFFLARSFNSWLSICEFVALCLSGFEVDAWVKTAWRPHWTWNVWVRTFPNDLVPLE